MIFELFKVQKRKVSELFLSGGYTFLKNSAKDSTIEKKTQMARSRMDTAKNRGSHLADSHKKIPNRCSLNTAGLRTQTPAQ